MYELTTKRLPIWFWVLVQFVITLSIGLCVYALYELYQLITLC